jgi:hypothetical protein
MHPLLYMIFIYIAALPTVHLAPGGVFSSALFFTSCRPTLEARHVIHTSEQRTP